MIEIPIAVRHLQVNTLTGAAMLHRFPIVGLLGLLHQIYGRFLHGFPVVGVLGLGKLQLVPALLHAMQQSIINLMASVVSYCES